MTNVHAFALVLQAYRLLRRGLANLQVMNHGNHTYENLVQTSKAQKTTHSLTPSAPFYRDMLPTLRSDHEVLFKSLLIKYDFDGSVYAADHVAARFVGGWFALTRRESKSLEVLLLAP